ncbi:MAG TPA: HEAT repeat domain-containing protein [Polyangiaceae bacterium]
MVRTRCAALLVAAFWGLLSTNAHAQGTLDVDRMIENLKNGTDFRVRTQAALALGASKSPRATEPLCSGLGDVNTTVRAAAAAALGKLQQGGAECLESRLSSETSPTVKAAIQHALDLVRGGAGPAIGPDTKFYVSIGKVTDKSGRTGDVVERLVRSAMLSIAGSLGIAIAPMTETVPDAKKRIASRAGLRAFFLSPRVAPIQYAAGDLKVRLEIAIFTYPDKNMIGNYAIPLTQQGVSDRDTASEDDLLKMASERAMEKLGPIAAQIQ